MGQIEAHDPAVLDSFEGLIFRTAIELGKPHPQHGPAVQMEREDVQQILRIKLYRALLSFSPEKIRKRGETVANARKRFVFMCLTDQSKDLRKRKRLTEDSLEGLAPADMDGATSGVQSRDRFELRYLSSSHDEVYGTVEDDVLVLPATLSELERRVVAGLMGDYKQAEVARQLGLEKREMEKVMRSIRLKLADWKPGGDVRPQLSLVLGDGPSRVPARRAAAA